MKVAVLVFQDGMGNLRLSQDGIHLEGISEFLLPLYVNEIQSREVSRLSLALPGDQRRRKPGYAETSPDIKISRWQLITSKPPRLSPKGALSLSLWASSSSSFPASYLLHYHDSPSAGDGQEAASHLLSSHVRLNRRLQAITGRNAAVRSDLKRILHILL